LNLRKLFFIYGSALVMVVVCVAVLAVGSERLLNKEAERTVEWKEDFSKVAKNDLPAGWKVQKKPGTGPVTFAVEKDAKGGEPFLHMESDKGSASLITKVKGIDPEKTPFIKWKWRVTELPEGGDGRVKSKDDQAIGIYVGTGSMFNNKSVSYRWDTDTPKGAEGNAVYGGGSVKVKWFTLRNREDAKDGAWYVEERNFAEDFMKAWGFYPETIILSISCNSQYTGTKDAADLGWIEFMSSSKEEEDK